MSGQLYEWSCSPRDANTDSFTLPNLGYQDDENVAGLNEFNSPSSDLDVYLIPSTLNCSGTVTAVEFCYFGSDEGIVFGTNYSVFDLYILEQESLAFTVTDLMNVHSTPSNETCTDQAFDEGFSIRYCCDKVPLSLPDQFRLPGTNSAFGAMRTAGTFSTLSYTPDNFPEFEVESYLVSSRTTLAVGDTLSVTDTIRRTNGLRFLQFTICKFIVQ